MSNAVAVNITTCKENVLITWITVGNPLICWERAIFLPYDMKMKTNIFPDPAYLMNVIPETCRQL
jgi:hypothetical protein